MYGPCMYGPGGPGGGIPGIMCYTHGSITTQKKINNVAYLGWVCIWWVCVHVATVLLLCGLCSGVFFVARRRYGRRDGHHDRGAMLRRRMLAGREHLRVSLAAIGPQSSCCPEVSQQGTDTQDPVQLHAPTCDASATLLCLNGLKSSLTCTGVLFLMTRVPKKGLGVAGVCASTNKCHGSPHEQLSDTPNRRSWAWATPSARQRVRA